MKQYKWTSYLLTFSLFILAACTSNVSEITGDDDSGTTTTDESVSEADESNSEDFEASGDFTWDTNSEVQIVLNGTAAAINGSGATASGSVITISSAGNYNISGTLNNGKVIVDTDDEGIVRLILSGASITCSNSAPVYVRNAEKTILVLSDNTDNYLTDGSSYVFESSDDDEPNAAVFSKDNMTIYGAGSLTVDANYNDGITSKDGLIIKSGNISVDAVDDGIRGKDFLIIKDGTISVDAGGDGLKSDNDEDATCGYISVLTGTIDITSGGDGIQAETDVLITNGDFNITSGGGSSRTVDYSSSAKGIKAGVELIIEDGNFTVSSADDALHTNGSLIIKKGAVLLASGDDGIHADLSVDIDDGDVSITKSVEAIESASITVNGGNVSLVASDDGFNATTGGGGEADDGAKLNLYGGYIVVNTSGGDGLDSNGDLKMTDGTVIVHGPQSSPEVGLDVNGSIDVTGGTLVVSGIGSNMTEGPNTSTSQYSVLVYFSSSLSSSTLFHIQDSNGNDVVTFQPVRSYSSMIYASAALTKGSTYYIYTGGTSTGTVEDGLYTGGTYSGGSLYQSFTVSGTLTTVGSSGSNPGSR